MGRSILSNIIHLFYSTILANLLQAVSLIVLANFLTHNIMGCLVLPYSDVCYVIFTDLGLSNTFLREGKGWSRFREDFIIVYKNKDDSTYFYFYHRLYCYSLYVCG